MIHAQVRSMDKREIRFDGWKVNFDSGEISRDGNTHRLQDQPLQILDELVQHPGEVVTREQLIARLWPTGVVEFDTGLNSAMRKLRIALGDDAETPVTSRPCPARDTGSSAGSRTMPPINCGIPTLPAAVRPHLIRNRRGHRTPGFRPARALQTPGARVRQHPRRRSMLAVVAWNMPGRLFQADADASKHLPTIVVLPLVDMSVDQSESGAVRRLDRRIVELAGAHPHAARRGAHLGVRLQGQEHRRAQDRGRRSAPRMCSKAACGVPAISCASPCSSSRPIDGLHIWSRSFDLPDRATSSRSRTPCRARWPRRCT